MFCSIWYTEITIWQFSYHTLYQPETPISDWRLSVWYGCLRLIWGMIWKLPYHNLCIIHFSFWQVCLFDMQHKSPITHVTNYHTFFARHKSNMCSKAMLLCKMNIFSSKCMIRVYTICSGMSVVYRSEDGDNERSFEKPHYHNSIDDDDLVICLFQY